MNRVQSDSYWYDTGYKAGEKDTIDKIMEIIDDAQKCENPWAIIQKIVLGVEALEGGAE